MPAASPPPPSTAAASPAAVAATAAAVAALQASPASLSAASAATAALRGSPAASAVAAALRSSPSSQLSYSPLPSSPSAMAHTPLPSFAAARARSVPRARIAAAPPGTGSPSASSSLAAFAAGSGLLDSAGYFSSPYPSPASSSMRGGGRPSPHTHMGGTGLLNASSGALSSSTAVAGGAESVVLRLHVLTFNMGNVTPSRLPPEMFGSHRGDADVYVVGTQESCPQADLDRLLAEQLPASQYTRVASRSLMYISLQVFARRDIEHLVACGAVETIATGIGNLLGNKGGIAMGLTLAGAHVLLVNCHLAAHDGFVERRNADFHRILAGVPLPSQGTQTARTASVGSPSAAAAAAAAVDGSGGSGGSGTSVSPMPSAAPAGAGAFPSRIQRPINPSGHFPAAPSPLSLESSPSGASNVATDADGNASGPLIARGPSWHPHNFHPSKAPGPQRLSESPRLSSTSASAAAPIGSGYDRVPSRLNRVGSMGAISGLESSASSASSTGRSALDQYDVVLWAGDLNYRIKGTPGGVKHVVEKCMYEVLMANDQLADEQRQGRVFQGFHEQPLLFPPTFKFSPGTDDYNLKRIPAWTDRVLFLCNSAPAYCTLRSLYYTCIHEMKESDHRPVVAGFEIALNPSKRHVRLHHL